MNRPTAIALGLAVTAGVVVVSVIPQNVIRPLAVGGLTVGTGSRSTPLDVPIFTDTTMTTAPLSVGEVIDEFTYGLFGDGSDGDCVWSVNTTLTDWAFCDDAIVDVGVSVDAPYPILVRGTLTLNGRIERNGLDGLIGSGGTPARAGGWLSRTQGHEGSSTTGYSGSPVVLRAFAANPSGCHAAAAIAGGGTGANGLDGETGDRPGCGGTSGSSGNSTITSRDPGGTHTFSLNRGDNDLMTMMGYATDTAAFSSNLAGGSSGGAGSNGSNTCCSGGGAGHVVVMARRVVGAGSIEAHGGAGSQPQASTFGNSAIGGGGGGGGGIALVVIGSGDFPIVSVAGGTGGNGQCRTTSPFVCGGRGGDGRDGVKALYRTGRTP